MTPQPRPVSADRAEYHDDIIYPDIVPFVLVHLACLAAIWTGVTWGMLALCAGLYLLRMFAVTAGYHRYFSHRSFRTSRAFQFVLAFLAQSTTQKSVMWWASLHRHHHKHSDTEHDVHSPRHRGFWYAHVGWIFDRRYERTDLEAVPDLVKYPELRFLQRYEQVPSIVLAFACWLAFGWAGLVVGFFWSTVLLYHGTFFINSLAHVHGRQRYATGDDSRNNWWLAIITLGEGWHNNHHAYQRSARQGFRWYEVDATYYALLGLRAIGVVRDLGTPPADVVENRRALGRATIERIARQLAERIDRDAIEACLRHLPHIPTHAELEAKFPHLHMPHLPTRAELEAKLPHMPSMDELRAAARRMIPDTPSMDEICARAHEMVAMARLHARGSALSA
ncbi:MAG: fatty acid desaturase [Cytophagaceae bacterium]|nr:fatty acid desaturase [Gemmatimonadaceae bacterium]